MIVRILHRLSDMWTYQLATTLVWENDTSSTENIGLQVHFSPCPRNIVSESEIQLISTSGIGKSSASLFQESDLVIDANRGDERGYQAAGKECQYPCR